MSTVETERGSKTRERHQHTVLCYLHDEQHKNRLVFFANGLSTIKFPINSSTKRVTIVSLRRLSLCYHCTAICSEMRLMHWKWLNWYTNNILLIFYRFSAFYLFDIILSSLSLSFSVSLFNFTQRSEPIFVTVCYENRHHTRTRITSQVICQSFSS